jgi:hypothetical protein
VAVCRFSASGISDWFSGRVMPRLRGGSSTASGGPAWRGRRPALDGVRWERPFTASRPAESAIGQLEG